MSSIAKDVLAAVRSVVGNKATPLHHPFVTPADVMMVRHTARTDPVGYGAIEALEGALGRYLGAAHVVCVSSGTAAIHLALRALSICGEDVMVPEITFAGCAAAVRYCGSRPVVGREQKLRVGIEVALLGHPDSYFYRHGGGACCAWTVIEDAAEAFGSRWKGRPLGTFGKVGALSFNNNKIVTTGGGGAVVTDDPLIAERVRHLATTAKIPSPWFYDHDEVGYNYRMGNLAAALGLGQVQRIEKIVEYKREVARAYQRAFDGMDNVKFWEERKGARSNYWLNAISVGAGERDEVLRVLTESNLGCRALFKPIHMLSPYRQESPSPELKWSEEIYASAVLLPSGRM